MKNAFAAFWLRAPNVARWPGDQCGITVIDVRMPTSLCAGRRASQVSGVGISASLLLAVRRELAEVDPQVGNFLFILDAGEGHLGAGYLGHRIDDVVLECRLAPDDLGLLIGLAIIVALDGAGLAAFKPVQHWPDLVLGVLADR